MECNFSPSWVTSGCGLLIVSLEVIFSPDTAPTKKERDTKRRENEEHKAPIQIRRESHCNGQLKWIPPNEMGGVIDRRTNHMESILNCPSMTDDWATWKDG